MSTMNLAIFMLLALSGLAAARSYVGPPGFAKNLYIRTLPAVPEHQSSLYEVYMKPFEFELRPPIQALVVLGSEDGAIKGELTMSQWLPGGPVLVEGNITGLAPGLHGLHVLEHGDLRDGCKSTGRHFNPYLHHHGGPKDVIRHLGDLGNLKADDEGKINVKLIDPLISLVGPRSIAGRTLSLSASEDDLGRAGTEESATNGSSGASIACGIVGMLF